MSPLGLVLGVVAAFFVIGVAVGIVAVIAMSAMRAHGDRRTSRADEYEGDKTGGWPHAWGGDFTGSDDRGGEDGRPGWPDAR